MPDTTAWDEILNSATDYAQDLQKLSLYVAYNLEEWGMLPAVYKLGSVLLLGSLFLPVL